MDTAVAASDGVAEEVVDLTVTVTSAPHVDVIENTEQTDETSGDNDAPSIPARMPSIVDTIPDDIKDLTIRNLDTNEEYVIGNDSKIFSHVVVTAVEAIIREFLRLYLKARTIRILNSTHLS